MGWEGRWLLSEGDPFSRIFHLVSEDEKVTPIKILLISITVSNVNNHKNRHVECRPVLTGYQQRPRCRPTSAASNMGSFPENMVGGSDSTPERRQAPERTVCVCILVFLSVWRKSGLKTVTLPAEHAELKHWDHRCQHPLLSIKRRAIYFSLCAH